MAEEQNDKPVAKDTASAASEGEGIVATGQPEAVEPRGWVSDWLDDWPWPGGLGRRFAEPWFRRPSGLYVCRYASCGGFEGRRCSQRAPSRSTTSSC